MTAEKLRRSLRMVGLSEPAIAAAWPKWWSDDAEIYPSAQAELRFSMARKLGLDPRSLIEPNKPRFVWRGETKFKGGSAETDLERDALNAFGVAVGRALLQATPAGPLLVGREAQELRRTILLEQPFVRLVDLLGLCWALGIPVIHLRVFPLTAKRMCAMAVRIEDRFAILLGKDAQYPAPIAYYLAHEIAHAALGHLSDVSSLVDISDPLDGEELDKDEEAADVYALEVLTGQRNFAVATETQNYSGQQLAAAILQASAENSVEPGTMALGFGHTTKEWAKVNAAMKWIYTDARPVWVDVNGIAMRQLEWTSISDDLAFYLRAVMGMSDGGNSNIR